MEPQAHDQSGCTAALFISCAILATHFFRYFDRMGLQGGKNMGRSVGITAFMTAALLLAAGPSWSEEAHKVISPGAVKWGPGPSAMPAGQMASVVAGDPTKSGMFIILAKIPDGYTVPPHWHSQTEHLTVLSGQLNIGMGDTLDRTKAEVVGAGSLVTMPANMRHYVWSSGETILQVTSMGPFDIIYVDPKDDPRNAKSQ